MPHPVTRQPVRRTALAAALLVLVPGTLAGCSWSGGEEERPTAAAASPAPIEQPEAPVEVIGAVDADDVEVGDPVAAPETGQGVYFVSDLYPLHGPTLEQPVLVRVRLDSALPDGTPLALAVRSSDEEPWRLVDGRLDAGGRYAESIVPSLGTVGVVAIDADSVRDRLAEAVDAALEVDATRPDDVSDPECDDTDGARDGGWSARSWKRATLGWCLGRDGDDRVLRVTNRRGVPVRVDAPGATDRGILGDPEGTAVRPDVAWDAWTAAISAGTDATAPAGTSTVLAPGQTLEVAADLEPGSSLLLTAADDPRNRSLQLLHAVATGLSAQVRETGLVPGRRVPGGEQVLAKLLAADRCSAALDGAVAPLVRRCLDERVLTRVLGDQALVVLPALQPRPTAAMLTERLDRLTAAAEQVEQRVEVVRDLPDFGVLVGRYTGTGRSLVVAPDGLVTETWGTAAGPVLTLGYQLSDPDVAERRGSATATVTSVQVLDRRAARGRVPRVGQAGVLSLAPGGVLTGPYLGATYCDSAAAAKGRCTDPEVEVPETPTVPTKPAKPARPGTTTTGAVTTPTAPSPGPAAGGR